MDRHAVPLPARGVGGDFEHRNVNIGSTCQASVTCTGEERLLGSIYCTLLFPVEAYLFISPTLLVSGVAGCISLNRHSIGLLGGWIFLSAVISSCICNTSQLGSVRGTSYFRRLRSDIFFFSLIHDTTQSLEINWVFYSDLNCYVVYLLEASPNGTACFILAPHSWGFEVTHNDAPQSVGLPWTRGQLVAETSTWRHTTLTTDKHPCPRRDSNPRSQQANGRRPTP